MVKIEIFERGYTYRSAITLEVADEDRNDLERVLLENKCAFKISAVEEPAEDENDENW